MNWLFLSKKIKSTLQSSEIHNDLQFSVTNKARKSNLQRLTTLIAAKYATNNFKMQRIKSIFVANFKTNERIYISK
jgi:hypothetical protein